jgi:histidinol-phosphate/aromatic aminotransferase/cobyric acid decarboxylase-like protein
VTVGTPADREEIYKLRHAIYALELRQHCGNDAGQLTDALDDRNEYLCVRRLHQLVGFISITSPGSGYSVDKYVGRDRLPFNCDDRLFEVRLLTVVPQSRGTITALLLMYAALRWVEAHRGTHIMAIGRRELLSLYEKVGFLDTGIEVTSGAVVFNVLHAETASLRDSIHRLDRVLARLESMVAWKLDFEFRRPRRCFHGGAFFDAIGPRCDALDRRHAIVNANVLDAWFPPSPRVVDALCEHLPWLLRTSPPTHADGLVASIAEARNVAPENILPGAGSSSLIYLILRHWLTCRSRVLVLDPMYSEYAHVLENVIGCDVDRFVLRRADEYRIVPERLSAMLEQNYDLIVVVNPNSPTGQHLSRATLERVLRRAPRRTRVWVDETYVEYVGTGESIEEFAAKSENVVVCKSMSKAYALSGARVAYLCAGAHQIEGLRSISPPWSVGLPAQLAAIRALEDVGYYSARWTETQGLRRTLVESIAATGCEVLEGRANSVLAFLPSAGPDAQMVVDRCRRDGVFLRNVSDMGSTFGRRALRIAVKDAEDQLRLVDSLKRAMQIEAIR